jgi:hypothetical protein
VNENLTISNVIQGTPAQRIFILVPVRPCEVERRSIASLRNEQ